jgi:hypothetical protein
MQQPAHLFANLGLFAAEIIQIRLALRLGPLADLVVHVLDALIAGVVHAPPPVSSC